MKGGGLISTKIAVMIIVADSVSVGFLTIYFKTNSPFPTKI